MNQRGKPPVRLIKKKEEYVNDIRKQKESTMTDIQMLQKNHKLLFRLDYMGNALDTHDLPKLTQEN